MKNPLHTANALSIGVLLAVSAGSFFAGRWSLPPTEITTRAAELKSDSVASARPLHATTSLAPGNDLSAPSVDAPSSWPEGEWMRLGAQRGSPARSHALAALLEQLAHTDPSRAMALAQAERNGVLKEKLVYAALRGWSATAPTTAVKWVYGLDDQAKRSSAMAVVFSGIAAERPDEAVKLGIAILKEDPGAATGYGCSLIEALSAAGHFEAAARFAREPGVLDPVGGSILMAQAYSAWAAMQPEEASRAALALTDTAARKEALNAVIGGWSQADPAGLTHFVAQLAPSTERIQMMGTALRQWAEQDPKAALQWAKTNEIGPGIDDGVAAMASAGFLAPAEAANWVESIDSPTLRSQTLLVVLRTWANADPEAAQRYFEQTAHLQPADYTQAKTLFTPPSAQ